MAPRGSKRVAIAAPSPGADVASPNKQPRVDPKLEGIVTTLQNAEHLNEHCREMLVAMTLGLATPKTERHPAQTLGVAMIEQTLQDAKAKFAEAVKFSQDELSRLEESNSTISTHITEAEASLAEKQAAKNAAHAALDAAKLKRVNAESVLAEAKEKQGQTDASVALLEKEKVSLEAAFEEHLITPMENDTTLTHHLLQPFVNKLDLEESLKMALPSSCVKTKDQRGSFDDLVINALINAWNKQVASLTKSIQEEHTLASDCKAAMVAAEASLEGSRAVEQTAATELEAARVAQVEAEGEVCKAKAEKDALGPKLKEAGEQHSSLKAVLDEYVDGTLATFETLRDKEPSETAAATAGA